LGLARLKSATTNSATIKASNMMTTVKRLFQSVLKQHVRNSVMSDEDTADELAPVYADLALDANDRPHITADVAGQLGAKRGGCQIAPNTRFRIGINLGADEV